MDQVEFYLNDKCFLRQETSIVPPKGSLINIRGKTYKVMYISYALDYTDQPREQRVMRANLNIKGPLT